MCCGGCPAPTSTQVGLGTRAPLAPPRRHRLGSTACPSTLPSPIRGSCGAGGCRGRRYCRVGRCGGSCSGAAWAVPAPGRPAGARAGAVVLGLAGLSHPGRLCRAWRGCAVPVLGGLCCAWLRQDRCCRAWRAVLHRGRLCWVWTRGAGSAGLGGAAWGWQGRCCRGPGWDCYCNPGLRALWKRLPFPLAGAGQAARGGVGAAVPSPAQREEEGQGDVPPAAWPPRAGSLRLRQRSERRSLRRQVQLPALTPVPPPAALSAVDMPARTRCRGGCRGSLRP